VVIFVRHRDDEQLVTGTGAGVSEQPQFVVQRVATCRRFGGATAQPAFESGDSDQCAA